MERDEIMEGLGRVIQESAAEEVDWGTVTESTPLDAFGLDSLSVLDLIFDLEAELGTKVEAADLIQLKTVGELVTYLSRRLES